MIVDSTKTRIVFSFLLDLFTFNTENSIQWSLFRSVRDFKQICAFLKNSLQNTAHKSINNFIFKLSAAQAVTVIVEENYIQQDQRVLKVFIGSFDEISPFVYASGI